jgi:hypothetical protein
MQYLSKCLCVCVPTCILLLLIYDTLSAVPPLDPDAVPVQVYAIECVLYRPSLPAVPPLDPDAVPVQVYATNPYSGSFVRFWRGDSMGRGLF